VARRPAPPAGTKKEPRANAGLFFGSLGKCDDVGKVYARHALIRPPSLYAPPPSERPACCVRMRGKAARHLPAGSSFLCNRGGPNYLRRKLAPICIAATFQAFDAIGAPAEVFHFALVAEHEGPTMFAGIGVMRALNRHVERVFDPSRKEKHWERRRLTRNQ
jgi:hypothetical protein